MMIGTDSHTVNAGGLGIITGLTQRTPVTREIGLAVPIQIGERNSPGLRRRCQYFGRLKRPVRIPQQNP